MKQLGESRGGDRQVQGAWDPGQFAAFLSLPLKLAAVPCCVLRSRSQVAPNVLDRIFTTLLDQHEGPAPAQHDLRIALPSCSPRHAFLGVSPI